MLPPREETTARARRLRQESTALERAVWARLRAGRLGGTKWHRQFAVGPYFADFYCHQAQLVLEIDGASHRESGGHDLARDRYMEGLGLRVLRIDSHALAKDFDGWMSAVLRTVLDDPNL